MLDDYFLGFIPETDPVRRIAYAASFGVEPIDIAPKRTALYSELLSRLDVYKRQLPYRSLVQLVYPSH